jgi:hypothetical protein
LNIFRKIVTTAFLYSLHMILPGKLLIMIHSSSGKIRRFWTDTIYDFMVIYKIIYKSAVRTPAMPIPDPYELTEIDALGRARLKAEQAAAERFAKVTADCPCDACPLASGCRVECGRFRVWVQTGWC